jgi:hypothetical protein
MLGARVGHVVPKLAEDGPTYIRHRRPRTCHQGTSRRAKGNGESEAEHERQDPVSDDRPENGQHKERNENQCGVFGIHRQPLPTKSLAPTWTGTIAII